MVELIDLSQEIYQGMPVYAGHPKTVVWLASTHEETGRNFDSEFSYQSLGLLLSDHGPTHVDSISHFDSRPDALTIDRMELNTFWGPGMCLDISDLQPREYCDAERLDRALAVSQAELHAGDVLLLRTGVAERVGGTAAYVTEYPGLDQSAADWLRDHRVKIFGVDAPSPDNPIDRRYPVHLFCRESGVTHYENLGNLGAVAGRRFTFFGLPLRIRKGHGSPVRAVALVDE
jgi:kynurenine formamidase